MTTLLADIGGTNARFSFLTTKGLGKVFCFKCDEFKTPFELIDRVLVLSAKKVNSLMIAVAGPVQNGCVQWTNRAKWKLSESELKKRYHLKKVHLYNDLYAQGVGLKVPVRKTILLMNVGTGFGSCLIRKGEVIPCEFGLVLDENFEKKEDTLSASGIVRLYHEFGGHKQIKPAKQIDELRKKDKKAQQAYQTFYSLWGKTAANLATGLILMDGVYLWGGLAPKNKKDLNLFLKAFHHPAYPKFTKKIPCTVVREEFLTLKGLKLLSKA